MVERARLVDAARLAGFLAALAIVGYVAVRAAQEVDPAELTWWPLALSVPAAVAWWLGLARGWALLVTGHSTRHDISLWCRTQALRFLPGGIWAPASRVVSVQGAWLDKVSTVAAENVIALCAALALGGACLAVAGEVAWAPLLLAVAVPVVVARLAPRRTRVSPERATRATVNFLAAFGAYAVAAALAQYAVSGGTEVPAVVGAALVAWGAGLVVIIAPGGVGVREVAYVGLLAGTLPAGEAAAGAVALRLVTIAAEVLVLAGAGRPR